MPEKILKFKCPEERVEFELANRGNDFYHVLWEFDNWLRGEIKYNDREDLQEVRTKLYELLVDNDLNLHSFG